MVKYICKIIKKLKGAAMKNYVNPEIECVNVADDDVLTTSPGTETPKYEENDGSWEISAGI